MVKPTHLFLLQSLFFLSLLFCLSLSFAAESLEDREKRVLGVLALQGVSKAYANWQNLADYLNEHQNRYHFTLRALNFNEIHKTVANKEIDYIIANAAYFVDLRNQYKLQAITTLSRQKSETATSEFGGLIVTQPHLTEAQILNKPHLKIAAVAPLSFGGYLVQKYRLITAYHLNPEEHSIQYFYQHNDVINAMQSGIFDLGFVRTGVFENHPQKLTVKPIFLNQQQKEHFPYLFSSYLYPEWPLARLPHVSSNEIKILLPLLLKWQFNYQQETLSWTAPLDYQPVDELFRVLAKTDHKTQTNTLSTLLSNLWLSIGALLALLLLVFGGSCFLYRKKMHRHLNKMTAPQEASNLEKMIPSPQQQLDLLKELVQSSEEGFAVVNAKNQFVFSNPAFRQGLKFNEQEFNTLELDDLFPGPEKQKLPLTSGKKTKDQLNPENEYYQLRAFDKSKKTVPLTLSVKHFNIASEHYSLFIMRNASKSITTLARLKKEQVLIDHYLQNTGELVFSFSPDWHLIDLSQAAKKLFQIQGSAKPDLNWIETFIPAEASAEFILQLKEAQRTDTSNEFSTPLQLNIHNASHTFFAKIRYFSESELDQPIYLCIAQNNQQNESAIMGLKFDDVVSKNQTGILMVNENGIIELVNPAAQKLLGRSEAQLMHSYFGTPILSNQGDHMEFDIINPDGSIGVAEITFSKTEWRGETAYLVMMYDITRLKEAQKLIQHQTLHDALTGLPNRRLLTDLLEQTIARHLRTRACFAILFLNIDGFKKINDSLGNEIGDLLLVQVAQRIQNSLKSSDLFARMGGDEFTIILESEKNKDSIIETCQQISQLFQKDFEIEGHPIHISISIGIALYPQDATDGTDLLKMADLAMHQAKQQINKSYDFFHEGLLENFMTSYSLENALKKALKNNEFELYYQPQVNAKTTKLSGVEALIRWHHPEKGMVRPDLFIPLLESTGLILEVGSWVLDEAIRQLKVWKENCDHCTRAAVNVSALQLIDDQFVDMVKSTLKKHDLAATNLALEITESTFIGNKKKTLKQIQQLKALGIQIHMDDFGTGYSSMAMLTELPFDVIKIDQSFVKNILNDQRERTMVRAIVDSVHAFNRIVLVEGVELEAQRSILNELNCDEIQGYLFDKPMPAKAFSEKYLQKP